jgi:hypothetical protein
MSANKPVVESSVTDSTIRSVVTSPFVAPIIFNADDGNDSYYIQANGFKYLSPTGDLYKRP